MSIAAPWLWIMAGVALAAMEMLVPTFVLIWPGAAAIAVGLLLFALPGLTLAAQLGLFALLAIAFTLAGRRYVMMVPQQAQDHPALNQRTRRLLGRRGLARSNFTGGRGTVEIDGELWQAQARGAVIADAGVEVVAVEGLMLVVEPR